MAAPLAGSSPSAGLTPGDHSWHLEFFIKSLTVYVLLHIPMHFILMAVSKKYEEYDFSRRSYIVAYNMQAAMCAFLTLHFFKIYLPDPLGLHPTGFYRHEDELHVVTILYALTDFAGIFLNLKNKWFTIAHHLAASYAGYMILEGFHYEGLPKGMMIYGWSVILSFPLFFYLANKFLFTDFDSAEKYKTIGKWFYFINTGSHWVWQLYYIFYMALNDPAAIFCWTQLKFALICCVLLYEDTTVINYLSSPSKRMKHSDDY